MPKLSAEDEEDLMMMALDACDWRVDDVIEAADTMTEDALKYGHDVSEAKIYIKAVAMGQMMAARKIGMHWRGKVEHRRQLEGSIILGFGSAVKNHGSKIPPPAPPGGRLNSCLAYQ
jgi:hypothetical protein